MILGIVHIALVAPHYHVGSFDDDSGYILSARALLHGAGLTGLLANGRPVISFYPPGFPALLAPLVAIFGHHYLALRVLSAVCATAVLPLTWWFLGRRGIGDWTRSAVLVLMALTPVFATYGSMVMAEMPFLVLLMVWLVLADRWERSGRALGAFGVGAVLAGAGLIWLKEAGLGLVVGLVAWLLIRRHVRQAAVAAAGTGLLLAPVVIARLLVGIPIAGARYTKELGIYYKGGITGHLGNVAHGLHDFFSVALPQTLLPSGVPPLPVNGNLQVLLAVWGRVAAGLCVLGAIVWLVRYRDAVVMVVAAYVAETLAYPFINQRRVVLVLPLMAAWYVIGGGWLVREGLARARRARLPAAAGVGLLGVALIVVPLSWQLSRDYLFAGGLSSSRPLGSPYMRLLADLGSPSDVVEADYLSTTALASGHRTAWTAFMDTNNPFTGAEVSCSPPTELSALESDHAAYLLTADLNQPGVIDSPCLHKLASSSPWAVELFHTPVDNASVFELIGPGTVHPDTSSLLSSASEETTGGVVTWRWSSPVSVDQVTVGSAAAAKGTQRVSVEEFRPGTGWVTVAAAAGGVGPGQRSPFLLASHNASKVTALRVNVAGPGAAKVSQVTALGSP